MATFTRIKDQAPDEPVGRIEACLRACEQALGVTITIHDHTGFFRDADDEPLLLQRNMHRHPYCQRERKATGQRCWVHCNEQVHDAVARHRRALATSCWKGVREIVLPLLHDEVLVATLYVGAWRRPRARPRLDGMPRAETVRTAWHDLPLWDEARGQALSAQLTVWAEGLVALVAELRFVIANERDPGTRIRRLVARHAHDAFTLADLAAELHLSPSRTSHLVAETCGMNFQSLLLHERIARAKVLLAASPHSLTQIAERCGFQDMGWFSRVFHREVGQPPGAYRRAHALMGP